VTVSAAGFPWRSSTAGALGAGFGCSPVLATSATAGAVRNVGKAQINTAPTASPSRLRRESTGLVWLAATSIVSRDLQNALSCGFRPTLMAVAQGP
jgi:hypothetical protein